MSGKTRMENVTTRTRRGSTVGPWAVFAVLVLTLLGAGWSAGTAQEEVSAAEKDTQAVEPAPREGVWVDFSFGTGIDQETRAVSEASLTFAADGERVYCLTRVHGMKPPATVTHAWYYEGRTMARVELNIGSENWRTWSYKSYLPEWTGNWEVKVLDEDGMVLGSAGFEVK
ncbi:MAG: DUF2914 domain-containing protein [Candidatus Krumholzibacteriota bacterium]